MQATLHNVSREAPKVRQNTTFLTKKPFFCSGHGYRTTYLILASAVQQLLCGYRVLFRVGIAFRIAEAISRGPLIGPCDGSTTRFTENSSTWLQRVRHVCKIDWQFLLSRDGLCSGTSARAVVHGNGPTVTPF